MSAGTKGEIFEAKTTKMQMTLADEHDRVEVMVQDIF